jgi:hypothetical protein
MKASSEMQRGSATSTPASSIELIAKTAVLLKNYRYEGLRSKLYFAQETWLEERLASVRCHVGDIVLARLTH